MDDADDRAWSYGSAWLNRVFIPPRSRPRRILSRMSLRLSTIQIVLIVFGIIFVFLVSWGLFSLMAKVPVLGNIIQPILAAIVMALPVGWMLGMKLSKASPYRRTSGEGLASYIWVKADNSRSMIGRLIGRKVATNYYVSRINGNDRVVECIEWLGTARAPEAPKRNRDNPEDESSPYFDIVPRTTPTSWVREARKRKGESVR